MFDWINRRVLARLPSRRLAATMTQVSVRGLHVRQEGRERLVAWEGIDRVVAAAAAQMGGGRQILVFGTPSGAVTVTEGDAVWRGLIECLHLRLPGAKRAAMWQLELTGGALEVEVYRR